MTDKITLTIDGLKITANKGMSILEAALENGIYIPHLCYHPDLESVGVCRLCLVEIEGREMTISCKTPSEDGMVVRTETPELNKLRKITLELLIVNHHADCLSCIINTDCKLQEVANYIGVEEERLERLRRPSRTLPLDTSNPFFNHDPNKCVLCGICVRTCEELQGVSAIDFAFRGFATTVATFGNKPLIESRCESCGECVVKCPSGALIPKNVQKPASEVKTICPYCGCGCGVYLGVRGTKIVSVRGDVDNPVNQGSLCVKGRFGYDFINHPNRLTSPLVKRNGEFVKVGWDEALDFVANKMSQYTKEQFAAMASAKCTNEENYLIQKFTRAVMGTNNIDHCARLCHAPTVTGLVQSLGSGAMTNSINEIAGAACIFAIGTNTTSAHPIIGLEIKKAVQSGAKLIVANPRKIDLCRFAHIFLRHRPGTDVALLMGLMRVIVDQGLLDMTFIEKRCENFEAFKKSLKNFNLHFVQQTTGVDREKIIQAARCYATLKPATILYAMGITQHTHGTDNVLATSNLALLTGNIGKPSTGVDPLRGQNNVQGACDMGALPDVYPGYQKVSLPEMRQKFATAWGVDELPEETGLTVVEIINAAYDGRIKALYIMGENPMVSDPDINHVRQALEKIDFLVVQDIFLSETAELADVVLPGASFAEKDGTFTNTERRIQRIRKAIDPVGESLPDWQIVSQIAERMGFREMSYDSPEEIMEEIASLTPIYGGIHYDRLENGGLQWPCVTREHPGTPILHTEQFATKDGKGNFVPLKYKPSAELPDAEYPLILTTERSLYQFHTATMTRKVEGLNILRGYEMVEMNPKDAAALGIGDGEVVRVTSRRGEVTAKVKVTEVSPPGVVAMSFHFSESPTNILTNPALDPEAKIPELKVCAVKVEKTG